MNATFSLAKKASATPVPMTVRPDASRLSSGAVMNRMRWSAAR